MKCLYELMTSESSGCLRVAMKLPWPQLVVLCGGDLVLVEGQPVVDAHSSVLGELHRY